MADDNDWVNQYPPGMDQDKLDRVIASQNKVADQEEAQRSHEKRERIKWLKGAIPNSRMYRGEDGRAWVETRRPANTPGLTLEGLMAAACSAVLGPEFLFAIKPGGCGAPAYIQKVSGEQQEEVIRTDAVLFTALCKEAHVDLTQLRASLAHAPGEQRGSPQR